LEGAIYAAFDQRAQDQPSEILIQFSRKRDWTLSRRITIFGVIGTLRSWSLDGGHHEDLDEARSSRAGSRPRSYIVSSGWDRPYL